MGLLRERAEHAVEEMDRPDCHPGRLERTYAQFALVNRAVSGWRGIYLKKLRPLLSAETTTTLLDIGCGGGDVPVLLSRWAANDGCRLEITAVDPDERACRFAARRPSRAGLTFRRARSSDLVSEGRSYDVVISNHVLHHLSPHELQAFLSDSAALCTGTALHNDLRRSAAAYVLFSIAALPLTGSYIRQDGLTSIRRSYTAGELAATTPPGWQIAPHSPFHHLLIYTPEPLRV